MDLKVNSKTWLALAYKDTDQGTVFILRCTHHDIIIGRLTSEAYGDIKDAKRIIDEINRRLEQRTLV